MIVIDTSLLVGFFHERDMHHKSAVATMNKIMEGQWGPGLLPEYVLLETITVLWRRVGFEYAQREGARLVGASEVELVPCSPYFGDAFEVFRTQEGTQLSLVDAAIVAIARKMGARTVGTFDRDFRRVAGLAVVPT